MVKHFSQCTAQLIRCTWIVVHLHYISLLCTTIRCESYIWTTSENLSRLGVVQITTEKFAVCTDLTNNCHWKCQILVKNSQLVNVKKVLMTEHIFYFYIVKKQKFYKSKYFMERNLTFANVCELNFPLLTLPTLLNESKSFLWFYITNNKTYN